VIYNKGRGVIFYDGYGIDVHLPNVCEQFGQLFWDCVLHVFYLAVTIAGTNRSRRWIRLIRRSWTNVVSLWPSLRACQKWN